MNIDNKDLTLPVVGDAFLLPVVLRKIIGKDLEVSIRDGTGVALHPAQREYPALAVARLVLELRLLVAFQALLLEQGLTVQLLRFFPAKSVRQHQHRSSCQHCNYDETDRSFHFVPPLADLDYLIPQMHVLLPPIDRHYFQIISVHAIIIGLTIAKNGPFGKVRLGLVWG